MLSPGDWRSAGNALDLRELEPSAGSLDPLAALKGSMRSQKSSLFLLLVQAAIPCLLTTYAPTMPIYLCHVFMLPSGGPHQICAMPVDFEPLKL